MFFPSGEKRWTVSTQGGESPLWAAGGDEVFYIRGNDLMAVDIEVGEEFEHAEPHRLFTGDDIDTTFLPQNESFATKFDVSADGERFLIVRGVERGRNEVVVV